MSSTRGCPVRKLARLRKQAERERVEERRKKAEEKKQTYERHLENARKWVKKKISTSAIIRDLEKAQEMFPLKNKWKVSYRLKDREWAEAIHSNNELEWVFNIPDVDKNDYVYSPRGELCMAKNFKNGMVFARVGTYDWWSAKNRYQFMWAKPPHKITREEAIKEKLFSKLPELYDISLSLYRKSETECELMVTFKLIKKELPDVTSYSSSSEEEGYSSSSSSSTT